MKTRVLGLRFTDEERADLERTAAGCGMKLTTWARKALLRDSTQVPAAHDHRVVATTKAIPKKRRAADKTPVIPEGFQSDEAMRKNPTGAYRPPPPRPATSWVGPTALGSLARPDVTPVPKGGKK